MNKHSETKSLHVLPPATHELLVLVCGVVLEEINTISASWQHIMSFNLLLCTLWTALQHCTLSLRSPTCYTPAYILPYIQHVWQCCVYIWALFRPGLLGPVPTHNTKLWIWTLNSSVQAWFDHDEEAYSADGGGWLDIFWTIYIGFIGDRIKQQEGKNLIWFEWKSMEPVIFPGGFGPFLLVHSSRNIHTV